MSILRNKDKVFLFRMSIANVSASSFLIRLVVGAAGCVLHTHSLSQMRRPLHKQTAIALFMMTRVYKLGYLMMDYDLNVVVLVCMNVSMRHSTLNLVKHPENFYIDAGRLLL